MKTPDIVPPDHAPASAKPLCLAEFARLMTPAGPFEPAPHLLPFLFAAGRRGELSKGAVLKNVRLGKIKILGAGFHPQPGPCLTIPAYTGPNGLPVGVQIVGPPGTGDAVITAGAWIAGKIM